MTAPILVVGADGMLGRAVLSLCASRGRPARGVTRPAIDLLDAASIERAVRGPLRAVVNCAAYTDVDGAEGDEATATAVNGAGVGNLVARCDALGVPLVHYSTDYVFDGLATRPYAVDHPTRPINAYGRSKRVGEERVRASTGAHLIIRTSWLYAPWGKSFVRTIARAAAERDELRVVDDQRGRPTSAEHLARTSLALLDAGAHGTFHATDGGECTWYDLAVAVAARVRPSCRVVPCSTCRRPRRSWGRSPPGRWRWKRCWRGSSQFGPSLPVLLLQQKAGMLWNVLCRGGRRGAFCHWAVAICLAVVGLTPAVATAQPHLTWTSEDPLGLDRPGVGLGDVDGGEGSWPGFPAEPREAAGDSVDAEEEAHWREEWTRFRWWQYAMTGTLFAATMVIETGAIVEVRERENWSGGILWDEALQDAIAAPTQTTRKMAARISDVFFHFNMSVPALIDPIVGGLLIHGDPDLAWQIFLIGAQARVVTGFLTRATQVLIGRDRPYVRHCESGEYLDDNCKTPGFYQSFFSGHTSLVFASAGATCSIHENIPLYGGGTVDDLACGVTVVAGALTGLFRLISDRHWSTDVLLGGAVGFSVGYFMPEWLQFTSSGDESSGVAVTPQAMGADGGGLRVHGWM